MTADTNFVFVRWCNVCNAEEAIKQVEAEIHGEWTTLDVGNECLTRMEELAMIDE